MKDLPANPTDFYAHVGLAIVQWSKVENALCDLFMRVSVCALTGGGIGMGKEKEVPQGEGMFFLGNVFYSNTNLRTRIETIDKMLKRLITKKPILKEAKNIFDETANLYAKRNVIAHGEAWAGASCDPEFMRYSIFSTKVKELSFSQIRDSVAEFARLADQITTLTIEINKELAQRRR